MINLIVTDENRSDPGGSGLVLDIQCDSVAIMCGLRMAVATAMWPGDGWATDLRALENWFGVPDRASMLVKLSGHPSVREDQVVEAVLEASNKIVGADNVRFTSLSPKFQRINR